MKFLINEPHISTLEKRYTNKVFDEKWLSINGKNTKIFENKFCKYLGVKYGIAVQSGTAALHTSLKALGVKKNDKVIIPSYTCVSNISVLSQLNAIPLIVDVEKETFGINYKNLEILIKKHKPKVLQLVHVYGFPAKNTIKILRLCKKFNIRVIEDASESLGAKLNKKKIGTFGDISVFSLRSEKMIGVGEGGIIVSNNKKLFQKINLVASRHAPFRTKKDPYWKKYYVSGEGYNYLMPHLLGSVARAQLEKFEKIILKKKIYVGEIYRDIFKENEEYYIPQMSNKNSKPAYWLNAVFFKRLSKDKVRKLGNKLIKNGVEVRSGFWPLDRMECFKSLSSKKKSNSDELFEKLIVLPSNIYLKKKDINFIKKLIDDFVFDTR